MTAPEITVRGVTGLPEVAAGADLGALIADAVGDLRDGDIVVVTSKIVSKAEGRTVHQDREAAIDAETVRVVARRGDARIVETRHGLVLAAAGVDASNTPAGTVVLLPEDPDESARRLRKALRARPGARVGVVVTDTLGRAWRVGQTDTAIGAAGVLPAIDYRGTRTASATRSRSRWPRWPTRSRRPGTWSSARPAGSRSRSCAGWPTWSPTRTARAQPR